MNKDEFRHRLAVELRNANHQHNRQWRSLADTAAASHVLRDGSPNWSRLRGGQDYYMEGMLFWLEVDARLRAETQGQKSLDDFCQLFFQADMPKYTAVASPPKPFDRDEVVATLTGLAYYDWDGLIRRRVESPQQVFESDLPELLGYRLELSKESPRIPPNTFRFPGGIDLYDSLGVTFSGDGRVRDVMLGSPADDAKLSPGLKIVGVNSLEWSNARLLDALRQAEHSTQTIDLLVSQDGALRTIQLHYHEGPKYLTLQRDESRPDVLEQILEQR
jgi:predicted metalloprotease with PDZ domain